MDLLSWSLNAIDTIWSPRKQGPSEPNCPDGTQPSGYLIDYSNTWRQFCLSNLQIEDVEDVFVAILILINYVLLGAGLYLILRKIDRAVENILSSKVLPEMLNDLAKIEAGQSAAIAEINKKLDAISIRLETVPNT